jgi:hypothetical protein
MADPWKALVEISGIYPTNTASAVRSRPFPFRHGYSRSIASGSEVGQVEQPIVFEVTVPASSTADVDLTALTPVNPLAGLRTSMSLNLLKAIMVQADPDNAGVVTLGPGVSNPFTLLFGASGSRALAAGEVLLVTGSHVVSGSAKVLRFTNAGASDATMYVTILGATA